MKDPEGALDFGHRETSDGVTVSGVYHVLLPDGRRQVRALPNRIQNCWICNRFTVYLESLLPPIDLNLKHNFPDKAISEKT